MRLLDEISAPLAKWSQGSQGNGNLSNLGEVVSRGVDQSPQEVDNFWNEARNRQGGWWRLKPSTPGANGQTNMMAQYEWVPGEPPAGYVDPFGGAGNKASEGYQISPFPEDAFRMDPSDLMPMGNVSSAKGGIFNNINPADILNALKALGLDPGNRGYTSDGSTGTMGGRVISSNPLGSIGNINRRPIFR